MGFTRSYKCVRSLPAWKAFVLAAALGGTTNAAIFTSNSSDAITVSHGVDLISHGLVAVTESRNGQNYYASGVFLTDLSGVKRTISPAQAIGTTVRLGGYGARALANTPDFAVLPQDGQPGGGEAPTRAVSSFNTNYYGATRFSSTVGNSNNVNLYYGDSGGFVGGMDYSLMGIAVANVGGTAEIGSTVFTRLDAPEIASWFTSYTAQGGVWVLTAGHVAQDSDGVRRDLRTVRQGSNANHPSSVFNVAQVVVYPTFHSNSNNVDLDHPDLALLRVSLPGDATDDNRVNFNDLIPLAQHYNQSTGATWANGDFTSDGSVNFDDLIILAQHYNTGVGANLGSIDSTSVDFAADWAFAQSLVPEPGSIAMVGLASLAAFRRRREH